MLQYFAEIYVRNVLVQPSSITVHREEYCHEVMSFTAVTVNLTVSLSENTPISARWGTPTNATHFYGYVHHVVPSISREQAVTTVVCIGSTYIFRASLQQTWTQQTPGSIVKDLATKAFFSAVVEPSVMLVSTAAAGISAWEFMTNLGRRYGYSLTVRDTELYFISPTTAIQLGAATAPSFTYSRRPPIASTDYVMYFRSEIGAAEAGQQTQRQLGSIDPRAGVQINGADSGMQGLVLGDFPAPLIWTTVDTDIVAHSPQEASTLLAARSSMQRFRYSAYAELAGNAQVRPGSVIYINNIDPNTDGYWYVESVEHALRFQKEWGYLLYANLGKDSLGKTVPPGAAGQVQMLRRTTPLGDVAVTTPPTVSVNNTWRSAWART